MNDPRELVDAFRADIQRLREQVGRIIVGQKDIVDGVLICLLSSGHALLEGVPGLGKTMLVRTLAQALELTFSRIQFTPDLMPADIVGTSVLAERSDAGFHLEFRPGPIFAHMVLADEVNRATPKTQSALLEAMQEHAVTVAKHTHQLEEPFFVLATQNPLEMEGTYPLPEAQVDRFLLKLNVAFPSNAELGEILARTTGQDVPEVRRVLDRARILEMRSLVRDVAVAPHVQDFTVRLLAATHPERPEAPPTVRRFVRYGASPRGAQACLLSAKVLALFDGRFAIATDDIRSTIKAALRHRIIRNFEGEAEGIETDGLIEDVLAAVPESPR